jgi:hypothetical protein
VLKRDLIVMGRFLLLFVVPIVAGPVPTSM